MGAGASIKEAFEFLGTGVTPAHVIRAKLPHGSFVAIDRDQVGHKDPKTGVFAEDVALKFGRVCGFVAADDGHNALEYTIQVEDGLSEVVRRRYLQPLCLPELVERGVPVGPGARDVAVEVEWQGGARFLAELLGRERGRFEVRFKGGKREVLSDVPAAQIFPVDGETRTDTSPETLAPDPLWLMDRKIQRDIDVKWPIRQRLREALELLQSQMRPPGAPPLRGPFVGERAFDSEGYPAHPQPLEELRVDGAFVDTWGKYAGKVKFATTYKIGPAYPRMDAWVDTVDAGDPLYFHAALPVYSGMICLGMYKNPGETGPGHPEWVRATDVALVGIALYANGELFSGNFTEPPLEKNGLLQYGHDCCFFIPGCVSTYMADCTWMGGVFCLAPTDQDFEVRDDIYTIQAYQQLLRDWSRRPRDAGAPAFGPREIELQVNLVLSTSYLATLRQVCAGSVRVTLTERGLAMAYDRVRDVQERRLESPAALSPKRPRKALAEITFEDGAEQRLVLPGAAPLPGLRPPNCVVAALADAPTPAPAASGSAAGRMSPMGADKTFRTVLEDKHGHAACSPQPPSQPPTPASQLAAQAAGTAAAASGAATVPIIGPDAAFRHLVAADRKASVSVH